MIFEIFIFILFLFVFFIWKLTRPSPNFFTSKDSPDAVTQIPSPPLREVLRFAYGARLRLSPRVPLHLQTARWSHLHGPIVEFCPFPGRNYLILRDPLVVQQIRNFPKPSFSQTSFRQVGRFGLLAMQDEIPGAGDTATPLWRIHRRAMQPFFALSFVRRLLPHMTACTRTLLHALHQRAAASPGRPSAVLDVHPMLTGLTLDIICKTSLGFDLNAVLQPDSETISAFKDVIDWVATFQSEPVHLWRIYPTQAHARFLRAKSRVHSLIHDALISRQQQAEEGAEAQRPTFLDALLSPDQVQDRQDHPPEEENHAFSKAMDEQNHQNHQNHQQKVHGERPSESAWSHQEIIDEVFTIIAAGHETTNNTLTFFLAHMAEFPEVQQRLHDEIDALLGPPSASHGYDYDSLPDFSQFKYLGMCLQESMRLTPAVPIVSRLIPENVTLDTSQGSTLHVKGGSTMLIDVGALNRDAAHWEKPDGFYPEHFSEQGERKRNPFVFIPFSVGGKSCLGSRFALFEAKVIAVMLLHQFEVSFSPSHPRMQIDWKITAKPLNGCNLTFTSRI